MQIKVVAKIKIPPIKRAEKYSNLIVGGYDKSLTNLTVQVPPLKSTPRLNASAPPGVYCRPMVEIRPASMIKIENAIKILRLPSQSM